MKIFEYSNEEINKRNSLIEALKIDINKKTIISFVGAGGKTSLIHKLGCELSAKDKKVIITTTTHIFMPKNNVVLTGKKDDIINLLNSENMITVGMLDNNEDTKFKHNEIQNLKAVHKKEKYLKKISGLPKEISEKLIELADFVLVEADGSKRLPLKIPAEHEPVILKGSNLVIGVCGIDAVGKRIKEICHRSNLVSKFLETDEEHIINIVDVAKILASNQGQRKNVNCNYQVIINKADRITDIEKAKNISKELSRFGINKTTITTFKV